MGFDIYIHCEMTTTKKLINTSTPHILFLFGKNASDLLSWKFQVQNTVLLTTVTTPYVRSLKLTHLITESLYP